MRMTLTCGVVTVLLASAPAADAAQHQRHHGHAPVARALGPEQPASAGPHMVEVKPGYWISSWDCVTDEGGGRIKPCSAGDSRQ